MNLLVFVRKFAPQNYIGAIRPTKISKYLNINFGYKISVFCQSDILPIKDVILERELSFIDKYVEIKRNRMVDWVKRKYNTIANQRQTVQYNTKKPSKKQNFIWRICYSVVRDLIYLLDIYDQFIYAKRAIKELKSDTQTYNSIFSSTNLIESYLVAAYLKKKSGLVWVLDFRDPILIDNLPWLSRKIYIHYIKKAAVLSDFITGVSLPCIDYFCPYVMDKNKLIVVSNGFDREDIKDIDLPFIDGSKLIFAYTGTIYNGKQDLRPFFKILHDCVEQQIIDINKIELHYAGHDGSLLKKQMEEYGLENILIDYGFVSRDESVRIQLGSDILLLASWNDVGNTGVITGKFYEYLMMQKNIVCIISGNLKGSLLKSMIDEAQCGFCYEEADPDTYGKLLSYIKHVYISKFINDSVVNMPNKEYIEQFNYRSIACKIDGLLRIK